MTDFKEEIRLVVKDTIKQELPKAIKKAIAEELNTISLTNPKKVIERHWGVLGSIIKLFKKK